MAPQAENLPKSHVSDSVTSGGNETANCFHIIHRYLHYQMLHMYLQFKLQQIQQQSSTSNLASSNDADSSFFESTAYQIALSDELGSHSLAREYFPEPINFVPQSDSGSSLHNYEFTVLDHSNPDPYHQLLPPVFHSHLSTLASRLPKLLLVGVQLQAQPVGFVSAICSPDRTRANILSFYVKQAHRQQGLGKQLLAQMEQVLSNHGCQQVSLVYRSDLVPPALAHILEQHHWSQARPYSFVCCIDFQDFKKAPWLYRHSLPASFTTFPWRELTPQQRAEIQAQQQAGLRYPPELDPFREEDKIEPITSLGLSYQGQVVGWMITHRIAPDTLRYSALFVKQDLPKARCAFPLLIETMKRQKEIPELAKATFVVMADNTPMIRFLHRHLAVSLTSIDQAWIATKLFNSEVTDDQR